MAIDYIQKSGKLIPRCGHSADKPTSPGSISEYWVDTDTDSIWKAKLVSGSGLVWVDITGGGGGGATELSDLTDVNTSTPTNRFALVADGVDWESRLLTALDVSDFDTEVGNHTDVALNTTHRGVVSGNPHVVTASDLSLVIGTDVQIQSAQLDDIDAIVPVKGDMIYYDGVNWVDIPIGTDNHVLKVNVDVPNWEAESGGGGSSPKFTYRGTANSTLNAVVAIGDLGVYPSIRKRLARVGVIQEASITTGNLVEVILSGEVSVVCAETISTGDQLRPYYDDDFLDPNTYIGRVLKWEGDVDDPTSDYGTMLALEAGVVGDTINATLIPAKNPIEDMKIWKLGESRLGRDTWLTEGKEVFQGEEWVLGTSGLGVDTYLGQYEGVLIADGAGEP
jgi:hypothetical protein